MLINFSEMEPKTIQAFKGGEREVQTCMFKDENGKIARFSLEPGASIGFHLHDTSSEMIYVISGSGKALFDASEEALLPGICHYCPKGHSHSVINSGNETLTFFAVVPEQ
ncbi:MAG: cupin domain-containing protein [Clostridia bacterium]|nr:cupin domain-containing protein [Clostridia bacterium]